MFKRNRRARKTKKYTRLERLAYDMGKIERGLKHDSRVKVAYDKGCTASKRKPRKPLI